MRDVALEDVAVAGEAAPAELASTCGLLGIDMALLRPTMRFVRGQPNVTAASERPERALRSGSTSGGQGSRGRLLASGSATSTIHLMTYLSVKLPK